MAARFCRHHTDELDSAYGEGSSSWTSRLQCLGIYHGQRQINLVSDPVAAETGSTSTLYDPTVANINTITAEPGFQITEVDVLVNNGETTSPEQFILPTGDHDIRHYAGGGRCSGFRACIGSITHLLHLT